MIRVSLVNHVATAANFSASTQASGYPASNAATPTHPFLPFKTTTTGDQSLFIDYGTAKAVDVWAAIRTNAELVAFYADDAPTFDSGPGGTPQYASGGIFTSESLNGRYNVWHRPASTVTRRYNIVALLGNALATPPHAAGASYYVLGGVWAGPLETVPRDILMDPELERQEPVDYLVLPSGVRQRSVLGYPIVTLTARRIAEQDANGLDTQLRQWLALDEAWRQVDAALVLPRDGVTSDAYVMRRLTGPKFRWGRVYSEGDLALEEIVG